MLRDYGNILRVFLHAPKEYRVQNIMEMYGDTEEDAGLQYSLGLHYP